MAPLFRGGRLSFCLGLVAECTGGEMQKNHERLDPGRIKALFFLFLMAGCSWVWATDIALSGILGSKALLVINGSEPKSVAVGQSVAGVKLISIAGDSVTVMADGKSRQLRVGQHVVAQQSGEPPKLVLQADNRGHFFTEALINNVPVKLLVDTGASMISLSASMARQMGLDLSRGERGLSNTANGTVAVTRVRLDTVRLGSIQLHGVDAVVHQAELPFALLGMSVLNRLEMRRDGQSMVLTQRY